MRYRSSGLTSTPFTVRAPADRERLAVIVKNRKIRRIVIVGITVLIMLV